MLLFGKEIFAEKPTSAAATIAAHGYIFRKQNAKERGEIYSMNRKLPWRKVNYKQSKMIFIVSNVIQLVLMNAVENLKL